MPARVGKGGEEVLKIKGELDPSGFLKSSKKMGVDWSKAMRRMEKDGKKGVKGTGKAIADFFKKTHTDQKKYNKYLATASAEQARFNKQVADSTKKKFEAVKAMQRYRDAMASARTEEEKLVAGKGLTEAKKRLDEAQKDVKASRKGARAAGGAVEDIEKIKGVGLDLGASLESFGESLKDAGEELVSPFQSLFQKDIPGALEKSGKLVGKGWEKLFKGGGSLFKGMGSAITKGGASLGKRMSAGGGMGGKVAGGAMEKMAGVVGKMVSGMGSMMKLVSTLGPIMMTVSSVLIGIVKLLIDAESGAKEFNKNILSTVGSSEFLHRNMKNSAVAANDLEDTLHDIRDAANSLDNMDWGINKETHTAVLNAITAEGVSLKKLDDDFKRVGKSSKEATGYAKDWGSAVQMSVAYSRAFGVSLQDVGQFEGEMMSELGMDLDHVESSFQYMIKGAEESGIATNKFFAIIRGFSADLTLFNIRMEDVTKTMVMLGKAMSPREAQKMLSSLNSMFKGKSLVDRTKDVIMGGPGVRKAMESQQAGGIKNLAETVGITPEEMKKVLKKDSKQLAKWLATDGKKLNADERKSMFEAATMQHKLDSGDTIDLASAIKDANPWTAKKIAEAKVAAITGGKKIEDLKGIDKIAAESAAEVNDELQDQIIKLQMGTETMKADLAEKLKTANGDASKFTKDEQKLLNKLGVKIDDGTTFDKLASSTDEDFYNSMDQSQKDILENGKKEIDYQKDIAGLQTSALDKLQVLIDFVMNQIYDAFQDIMDFVSDMADTLDVLGTGKTERMAAKERRDAEKQIVKSGNKELLDAWNKSDGSLKKMKAELSKAGGLYDRTNKSIDEEVKHIKELQATVADPKTSPDDKKKAQEQLDTANKLLDEYRKGAIKVASNSTDGYQKLADAMGLTAEQQKGVNAYLKEHGGGGSFMEALKRGGVPLDADTIGKLAKAGQTMGTNTAGVVAGGVSATRAMNIQKETPEEQKRQLDQLKAQRDAAHQTELAALGIKTQTDAQTTKGSIFTHDIHAEETAAEQMELGRDQADTLDDIYRALRFRGIKIDKPFLQNQFKEVIHDAVFDAASEALVDYYVLEHVDADEALNAIKKGADPKMLSRQLRQDFAGDKGKLDQGTISDIRPKPNAAGGVISAIRNGMAIVRPAAGEGVLTGRPGETIGRGGGGGTVTIMFKGDAGKLLDARMQDNISRDKTQAQRR